MYYSYRQCPIKVNGKVVYASEASLSFCSSLALAPAAAAGSTTYTLPSADGTSGQVLSTNGSGSLSWTTASGITTGKSIAMAMIFGF